MMQGGINNAALFGASQRSARSKLDQMAGIQRPSGILASSSELMQAAMPARPPMPAPQPVMQQPPASMVGAPMAPPPMPSMPMPTTVAPRPLNPMAGNPTAGQPVVKLNEGGFLDKVTKSVNAIPGKMAAAGMFRNPPADAVDITVPPEEFKKILDGMNPVSRQAFLDLYGSEADAAEAMRKKVVNVQSAAESKDPAQTADQVLIEAGEQPTDAAKIDFAENVLGLDINDIDEINRRIDNVVVGNAVGKGPDAFAEAVIMGLQNYKQTASARAAAAAGSGSSSKSGMSPLEPFPDAVRDLAGKIMTATGEEAAVAIRQAEEALRPYYTNQAGPTTAAPTTTPVDGGLPAVSTQAEYDALPSGAEFVQNGQKRKKP